MFSTLYPVFIMIHWYKVKFWNNY